MTHVLRRFGWARAALAALALAVPASAHADAVPPPPTFCPPGTVGTTSHHGPECAKKAPKNCPPGWRGILGGTCMLTPCSTDASCGEGEVCVEHLTCLEPYQDDFYDWGEEKEETGARDEAMPPPDLLAAPPAPRMPRPSPITRYNAVNLCSAEVACNAPRMCLPEKLCVPKGGRALAYRGTNINPARVARKGPVAAAPVAPSASTLSPPGDAGPTFATPPDRPTPGGARPLEGTAPPSGGCAGCAVGDASVPMAGMGIVALAALLWARARRRSGAG